MNELASVRPDDDLNRVVPGRIEKLVNAVCGSPAHPLAPFLRRWCVRSRPFLGFLEANATKIRRKVRLSPSEDELGDLLAELGVAVLLTQDRRVTVRYEPLMAGGTRGPDFEARFASGAALSVEVTRPRHLHAGRDPADAALRVARVVRNKLGQFPAGTPGLLVVVVTPDVAEAAPLSEALSMLRRATVTPDAESPKLTVDPRSWRRLGGVALCTLAPDASVVCVSLRPNPDAKLPLRPEVARLLAGPPP